jgi:hypothetical protein
LLKTAGTPTKAVQQQIVPETDSPDLVFASPCYANRATSSRPAEVEDDPVLAATLRNNKEGLRKRRVDLELSPDVQVSIPPKYRVVAAKANLSQRFN